MGALNLYHALCEIREYRVEPSCGICGNLHERLIRDLELPERGLSIRQFRDLCEAWPEYSGAHEYPVWTDRSVSPLRQYEQAQESETLWDSGTSYGAARWRLLNWAIAELEARIG